MVKRGIKSARARIAALNKKLKPIADCPVDTNDPHWEEKLRNGPRALDAAGVRKEAESTLEDILEAYATGDDSMRASLRKLFAKNSAFSWATGVASSPTTARGFRRHLLLISVRDQSADFRDTLLYLNDVYKEALAAGVDTGPVLREVAELSSDKSETAMGSLKSVLLRMS